MSGEIPRMPWVDAYEASVPEWDVCDVFPCYVSAEWDGQVYQRVRRDPASNQVVDFAVAIQVRPAATDEGWIDLARIDCAHGEVHIHATRDGEPVRDVASVPSDCAVSLDRAYLWGVEYVWDLPERLKGLA